MIKLAVVLDDPGYGGAYKLAKDVGESMDKTTFEVRYYFLCEPPENPPNGTFLGKPSINIDYSLRSYLRLAYWPKSHEKSFLPLNKVLSNFDPDIVHFHTHAILLTLLKSIREVCPKAQLIYTDHSQRLRSGELSLVKQYLMSRVYRRLFRLARVAYVSRYAYETALALGYGCRDKCWMVTNTIDTQKFKPKKSSTDTIRVVYLSRIHPAKGHHLLLDAWRQLPKSNKVSLHLYGKETDNGSVRERIRQESFPNPVVYEGITSSPERVIQNAQIGVFPSYREGLPLALLEMMGCGLPVVASDIPEIKNVVTDGKDGLLYPSNKATELASQLLRLINDKSLREGLGKQAHVTVEQQYSEPIALKYNQLYKKLIQKANEKKNCHSILYLHGRPMAHPMHLALARSVGSDLYPVDRYMRWQDTSQTVIYRMVSWLVNALVYPVQKYTFILVDNLHFSPVIARKLGLLKHRKIIVHLGSHTLYFMYTNRFSPWVNKLHRYALRNYDALLCEGKMAAELVDKILGASAPPTYVTYLGVPSTRWAKLNRIQPNLQSKTIIIIANGPTQFREWYKGLDVMVEAFSLAKKKDETLRLLVIGVWNDDIIQANLKRLDEKTRESINFLGRVDNIDLFLKESALCLHCTRGDAFPTSTLEAMAAGVVPLVSDFTGTKEVVEKVNERLVVSLNVGKIAETITWYFSLPHEKRMVLSNQCRKVVQDYTEERSVAHYQQTFQKMHSDLNVLSKA